MPEIRIEYEIRDPADGICAEDCMTLLEAFIEQLKKSGALYEDITYALDEALKDIRRRQSIADEQFEVNIEAAFALHGYRYQRDPPSRPVLRLVPTDDDKE